MRKAIRRYKLGYALGATLLFIGLTALLFVLWNAWPSVTSSAEPLSAFWAFLWEEQLNIISGIEFKMMYLVILAAVAIPSGIAVLMFSRQWFFLPGRTISLQCPFCKKLWHASYDRGQVLCPHCHHLIHPKMIEE